MVINAGIVCYKQNGLLRAASDPGTGFDKSYNLIAVGPNDINGVDLMFENLKTQLRGEFGCLCICLGFNYDSEIRKKFIEAGKNFGFTKVHITDWCSMNYYDLVSDDKKYEIKENDIIWIFCGKYCYIWRKDTAESLKGIRRNSQTNPNYILYGNIYRTKWKIVRSIFRDAWVSSYTSLDSAYGALIGADLMAGLVTDFKTEPMLERDIKVKVNNKVIISVEKWQSLPFTKKIFVRKPYDCKTLEIMSHFNKTHIGLPELNEFDVTLDIDDNGICCVTFNKERLSAQNSEALSFQPIGHESLSTNNIQEQKMHQPMFNMYPYQYQVPMRQYIAISSLPKKSLPISKPIRRDLLHSQVMTQNYLNYMYIWPQKESIRKRLFPLISSIATNDDDVEKITAKMLEMDNSELLVILEDDDLLKFKVAETIVALNELKKESQRDSDAEQNHIISESQMVSDIKSESEPDGLPNIADECQDSKLSDAPELPEKRNFFEESLNRTIELFTTPPIEAVEEDKNETESKKPLSDEDDSSKDVGDLISNPDNEPELPESKEKLKDIRKPMIMNELFSVQEQEAANTFEQLFLTSTNGIPRKFSQQTNQNHSFTESADSTLMPPPSYEESQACFRQPSRQPSPVPFETSAPPKDDEKEEKDEDMDTIQQLRAQLADQKRKLIERLEPKMLKWATPEDAKKISAMMEEHKDISELLEYFEDEDLLKIKLTDALNFLHGTSSITTFRPPQNQAKSRQHPSQSSPKPTTGNSKPHPRWR